MRRISLKRVVFYSTILVAVSVYNAIRPQRTKCSTNSLRRCPPAYTSEDEAANYKYKVEKEQVQKHFFSSLKVLRPPRESLLAQDERFVLILIMSAPYHMIPRLAIRQTWLSILAANSVPIDRPNIRAMKDPVIASNNLLIEYFFVCGLYQDPTVESDVENEIRLYGDILRLGYTESYSLLVYKTLASLRFASTMNAKFIVKIDDDVYFDAPRMVWWLKTAALPEKLYAGEVLDHSKVIREKQSKYYVSNEDYNETAIFPVYCNGPFYVLSKNVVLEFLAASENTRTFPLEDAYLGVLAKKVGIVPTRFAREKGVYIMPSIRPNAERKVSDRMLNRYFAVGHSLTPRRLLAFYRRYVNLTLRFVPWNDSARKRTEDL